MEILKHLHFNSTSIVLLVWMAGLWLYIIYYYFFRKPSRSNQEYLNDIYAMMEDQRRLDLGRIYQDTTDLTDGFLAGRPVPKDAVEIVTFYNKK